MSRCPAADLARFRLAHPLWEVRRDDDGFTARRGGVIIAARTLTRLAGKIRWARRQGLTGGDT
jgi:hypothetical protein